MTADQTEWNSTLSILDGCISTAVLDHPSQHIESPIVLNFQKKGWCPVDRFFLFTMTVSLAPRVNHTSGKPPGTRTIPTTKVGTKRM
mmetsp:Transcript_11293/g.25179  ORF Transcript_11293/g.25179 Transcript_11293/m.25179 type:complete len:87 (-) Transcript_11293:1589-1849(-)